MSLVSPYIITNLLRHFPGYVNSVLALYIASSLRFTRPFSEFTLVSLNSRISRDGKGLNEEDSPPPRGMSKETVRISGPTRVVDESLSMVRHTLS